MALPSPKQIKDLLEGLLGRDVVIGDGPPVALDGVPRPMLASYADDSGRLSTVVATDFALTAYTGAALGLVPKGGAQAALEDGALPASLQENTAEVLNVLAAPLGEASGIHQRLTGSFGPQQMAPSNVSVRAATLGSRADFEITIEGYGTGGLSIVATPG